MAIQPKCYACHQELTDYGAILLSPPEGDVVDKYHLCQACYGRIMAFLAEFNG